ncbi:MAG: DUF5103 domain-containing protein [Bacteroidales bacterium]|nr:DUF5103 domain-containing protein [Bacteroidales bacterium]
MMKKYLLFVVAILFVLRMDAQWTEEIHTDNYVYSSGIRSITLHPKEVRLGEPVAQLGGGDEQLTLEFDDVETDDHYLKYTFIHCTHDWKISDMNQVEYIDGFNEDLIDQYDYSFNTIVHYTHYQLSFPNRNMSFTKSGNYILFVYDDTPDRPVMTRRFMVVEENTAKVSAQVHHPTDVNNHFTHQEVSFEVSPGPYIIRNPAMTLHATIKQNGRWDNAKYGLTYHSFMNNRFTFDYQDGRAVFPGGAEFHTFDIGTLRSNGDRIVSIDFAHRRNQAYVLMDEARPYGAYESRSTMNGACVFYNRDLPNPYSEDYVNTYFTLKSKYPFTDGDVYVFGELTDWKIKDEAKLHYVREQNYWEASFYIKQGRYNYQYVYVPYGSKEIDATYIEGSHYETHNQYTIFVYFREEGTSYDKLIAVEHCSVQ